MHNLKAKQNIPNGWTPAKVGDLGFTYSGLRSKNKSDFGYGSPFITYMNIFTNSKIDKNRFDLVNVGDGENQSKVKYGDVFFTVSSETPEEVGMSSVLLDEIDNYYLNSFCFGFRLNDFNTLLPQYARFLFRGQDFRSKIIKLAQGSTRFNLSKERVLSLDTVLPPIIEQQKIADILGTVDEDIVKTEELIKATEKLKRGLMQQLFTRGIGHTKFKETKIGKIPEEWKVVSLDDVSENLDNKRVPVTKSKRREGIFPYYGATGIVDYVGNYIFNEELLLISEDGANLKDRNYPIAFTATGKYWVNNHAHIQKFDDKFLQKYVQDYLNMINLELYLTGMAQPKLNKDRLFNIPIPKPKKPEEVKEISEILSAVDEKISVNKKLQVKLAFLKKGLMQDLLSGKVRIN